MTMRGQPCTRPAFLTGTSAEYLKERPLPRVIRSRPNIVLLGPPGSGKTMVAWNLGGSEARYLDKHGTQNALVAHVRSGRWSDRMLQATSLILDGPVWLSHRPAAVQALRQLLDTREALGHKTILVQDPRGGSVYALVDERAPGSTVLIGLRFPEGRSRKRYVRSQLVALGASTALAPGLCSLDPWTYLRVQEEIKNRLRAQP